jgi:hypothetical protein
MPLATKRNKVIVKENTRFRLKPTIAVSFVKVAQIILYNKSCGNGKEL